jgi:hypothetical protein
LSLKNDSDGVAGELSGASQDSADRALARDLATKTLIFAPEAAEAAVRTETADPTVTNCVRRFFDPAAGIPFVPADVARYFPVALLLQDEEAETEVDSSEPEEEEVEELWTLLDTANETCCFPTIRRRSPERILRQSARVGHVWDVLKVRKTR